MTVSIITIELVNRLNSIDIEWIERFINGEETNFCLSPESCVALLEIVERLKD